MKMIKMLFIIFVVVIVFTSSLYLWLFEMLGTYITIINTSFLPFIPLEIRLWFFLLIFAIIVALAKSFIN